MKEDERSPDSQAGRRRRLMLIAALNLLLWLVVTGGVVLLVSRRVDLGVETFFREGPATLIAALRNAGAPSPSDATESAPTVPLPPGAATSTSEPASATQEPEDTLPASPTPDEPGIGTPGPGEQEPTPQSPEELISHPLNLLNAPVESVLDMDTEMLRSAAGRSVLISYSEEALNREITRFLQSHSFLPYDRVEVDLLRDGAYVEADVTVEGITARIGVAGRVGTRDCRTWAEIDAITVADMPTPGLFREGIARLLEDALSWIPPDYPLCLEWILLDEEQVTVYASRR